MMPKFDSPEAYFESKVEWKHLLHPIRQVLIDCDLDETLKWGQPAYIWNRKNIIGLFSAKKWVALWFHQGVFLSDPAKVLVNAQEGKTMGLRQWRINNITQINKSQIKKYVLEAIENCEKGLEIKPKRTPKPLVIPEIMRDFLDKNTVVFEAFEKMTNFQKREFAEYISTAKRASTKISRLDKISAMILKGEGLNDKYR